MNFDLIVPGYNPVAGWEKKFVRSVRKLQSEILETGHCLSQIFIIDDGSDVNFNDYETNYISDAGITVNILRNERNYGKGYSIRKACEFATAACCVYTDLDFPFGTESIIGIVDLLEKGYDIAVGRRSKSDYFKRASFWRMTMSKSLMLVNKIFLDLPVDDTQAGIKGFNRTGKGIMLSTTINRFLFDLEFMKMASSNPEIKIVSIAVANDTTLNLSSFSFKVIAVEFCNFIKIMTTNTHVSRAKKSYVWD